MLNHHTTTFGTLTQIGSCALIAGAVLVDLSTITAQPVLAQIGYALTTLSGLGVVWLPFGLAAAGVGRGGPLMKLASAFLVTGLLIASIVDVPSIFNRSDLSLGASVGPVGLILLSLGFVLWFAVIHRAGQLRGWRKWIFLLAGLWLPMTFPTIQLPLFIVPTGEPSLLLLAGVHGALMFLMGGIILERAQTSARLMPQ